MIVAKQHLQFFQDISL